MIETWLQVCQRNGNGLGFTRCNSYSLIISLELLIIICTNHRLHGYFLFLALNTLYIHSDNRCLAFLPALDVSFLYLAVEYRNLSRVDGINTGQHIADTRNHTAFLLQFSQHICRNSIFKIAGCQLIESCTIRHVLPVACRDMTLGTDGKIGIVETQLIAYLYINKARFIQSLPTVLHTRRPVDSLITSPKIRYRITLFGITSLNFPNQVDTGCRIADTLYDNATAL